MKILWTTITVNDLDETLGFYKDVFGVEPERRFKPSDDVEIAFLTGDGSELELIQNSAMPKFSHQGLSMGFDVESVDAKKAELEAKGYETTPIVSPNPHLKFFFIKDPNGVSIQFAEQL